MFKTWGRLCYRCFFASKHLTCNAHSKCMLRPSCFFCCSSDLLRLHKLSIISVTLRQGCGVSNKNMRVTFKLLTSSYFEIEYCLLQLQSSTTFQRLSLLQTNYGFCTANKKFRSLCLQPLYKHLSIKPVLTTVYTLDIESERDQQVCCRLASA